MRIFVKKSCKIAAASVDPPPNPHWPRAAGGSAPRHPQFVFNTKDFNTSYSSCFNIC